MATPSWAQKPLPPGWEAKYDKTSRKYFFVNHATKMTQWVDPRAAYYYANLSQPPAAAQRPPEAIRMTNIVKPKCYSCRTVEVAAAGKECHTCQAKRIQTQQNEARQKEAREAAQKKREQEERIKQEQEKRRAQSAQRRNMQETHFGGDEGEEEEEAAPSLTPAQKAALLRELSAKYPDVSNSVVDMVLESCQFKRVMAIGVLNSMSTSKASTSPAKAKPSPKPSPQASPRGSPRPPPGCVLVVTGPDSTETNLDTVAATSAPSEPRTIPVYERITLVNDLRRNFPSVTQSVISMILEQNNFDKEATAAVLTSMSQRGRQAQASKASPRNMPIGQLLHQQRHTPSPQAAAQNNRSPSPAATQISSPSPVYEFSVCKEFKAAAQTNRSPSPRPTMKHSVWQSTGNAVNKNAFAFDIKWDSLGRQAASKSPAKKAEPKQMTPQQKNKAKQAVKKKFPQASDAMVTMALESTNFDQTKAEAVLNMLKDDTKKSSPKKSTESSSDEISSFMSVKDLKDLAKRKGVDISGCIEKGEIIKALEKAAASASAATSSQGAASSSKASTSSASAQISTPKLKITKPASPKKQKAKPRSKGQDKRSTQATQQRSEFTSSHSSMAKGPDTSLVKGPDKELLIDNYVKEGGHDTSLCSGPNKAYVTGPSEISIKNSGLASGPQASLRNGPQGSLAKGSLYQGDRQS